MRQRRGQWAAIVVAAMVIVGLTWSGWRWWDLRRYRDSMARIEDAMQNGRYAVAARDLLELLGRRLDAGRAAYLLGECEKARGRIHEADEAWARIGPESPFYGRAVADRMDMLVDQGRLADAEAFILRAAADARGTEGSGLRMLLIPTFIQEGRGDEALRLIESRWRDLDAKGEGATEQAINLARLHVELRWNAPPVDLVRTYLDQVGQLAPTDDRIWLGRAHLAIRTGSYDEAARWINPCLDRRPDDPSVWRAKRDWAMKTNRPADVRTAIQHLPAGPATPADTHRVSAWLASACGDLETEQRELAAAVAEAPEDFGTLDRLETLEKQHTTRNVVDERRRWRVEIQRAAARYRALYQRNQPSRDAEEMARLAERLGHRFEAIVFLSAAVADEPERSELRPALEHLKAAAAEPDNVGRSELGFETSDPGRAQPRRSAR